MNLQLSFICASLGHVLRQTVMNWRVSYIRTSIERLLIIILKNARWSSNQSLFGNYSLHSSNRHWLTSEYGNPPSCRPHKVSHLFFLWGRKIGLESFFHLEAISLFLFCMIVSKQWIRKGSACLNSPFNDWSYVVGSGIIWLCDNDFWFGDSCFLYLWNFCIFVYFCGLLDLEMIGMGCHGLRRCTLVICCLLLSL